MSLDFQVITFGRVGTMALNRFLMAHPEIGIHHFDNIVKAFQNVEEGGTIHLDWSNSPEIKTRGITFHDLFFFKPRGEKALDLIRKVKTPKLIHSVRHPIDSLISWVNYVNSRAILDPKDGWKHTGNSIKNYLINKPQCLSTIKFGYQAEIFYPNAQAIHLVDFENLSSEKINETMNGVFEFLGVSPYVNSVYSEPQNTLSLQLHEKGFSVNINGENVQFSLRAAKSIEIANKNRDIPITIIGTFPQAGMNDFYRYCPSVTPINDDVVIVFGDTEQLNYVKDETVDMVFANAGAIVQQAMPQWARWAEETVIKINAAKITRLNDEDYDFVKTQLKEDIELFASYHPEYRNKWAL